MAARLVISVHPKTSSKDDCSISAGNVIMSVSVIWPIIVMSTNVSFAMACDLTISI